MNGEPIKTVDPRGVRSDPAPLLRRFPNLGHPVKTTWSSGTLGDVVVGPTSYWIDAVVEVTDEVANDLRALAAEGVAMPSVISEIAVVAPEGPFVGSPQLNSHLVANCHVGTWWVSAAVSVGSKMVVLTAVGE